MTGSGEPTRMKASARREGGKFRHTVGVRDHRLTVDAGPIIGQQTVPVLDDDTPESLAARVHALENELYPEAIRLWTEGRLRIEGRRVRITR